MIEWLIDNCPRKSICRALQANEVEFLGGFTKIPPSNLPGWIFAVRLPGKIKNLCILANDKKLKYEIRIVKCVPWENWNGGFYEKYFPGNLQSGDKPLTYEELKNAKTRTTNNRSFDNS